MKLLTLILALCCTILVQAQDIYDFNGLKSSGELTSDFNLSSSTKSQAQIDTLSISKYSSEGKVTVNFIEQSNYMMDQLLSSGEVLVNDYVGDYVNEVLDTILKHEPELQGKIRAYVSLAPDVNAFANDRGVILINLGLFNKINNEAELASILCHEITHFAEQHNLSSRLKAYEISTERGTKKVRTLRGFLLRKHAYDRNLEYTADRAGATRLLKTNYKRQAALDVFNVLDGAWGPYKNTPLAYGGLNAGKIQLDSIFGSYYQNFDSLETANKEQLEEYQDEDAELFRTHPAVEARRVEMNITLEDENLEDGEWYLVSEDRFKLCQQMARLQVPRLRNSNGDHARAIFHSLLIEEELPNHPYNDATKATSMYLTLVDKYKDSRRDSEMINIGGGEDADEDNYWNIQFEPTAIKQFQKFVLTFRSFEWGLRTYAHADSLANT
ncbi:MAG: M48 family metalloprotease, partial [Flavobacteriales bacterium]|nr:M48 family metalloprotease [Flavobacteriales bacterium]